MPFQFEAIPEKKVNVKFEFKGQSLNAVINANAITQETANSNEYAYALSCFVESWDAEDGQPTLGFLRKLPMEFLVAFFTTCMAQAFPKDTTAEQ